MNKFLATGLALLMSLLSLQASAGEAEVRKAAQAFLGDKGKVESVRKSSAAGLYEVQLSSNELFYVDDSGSFAFIGDMVDMKQRRNLSEERRNKLAQIKFSELPVELAIKQVRGNGKRVFATFEDPNCGYCKKLAREMQGLNDVTIYTFAVPILGQDSYEKSRNIMCAADPAKVWNDWMVGGNAPPTAKCDNGVVDKVVQLGQRLNVRGTPSIFLADGTRLPGYVPAAELEKKLGK